MNKHIILSLTVLAFFLALSVIFTSHANASVVTYPAPSGAIPLSSAFTVTADGNTVDTYQVKVPPQWIRYTPCPSSYETAAMAYFDFSGTVNVRITSAVSVSSVVVRPLRHGIQPTVNGNTISFSLSSPANLSIEINGDDRHNLHLFANPMEVNKPSPSDPNIQYYGPGVHGDGSRIYVAAGKTVYIAGGAIVYASFRNNYSDPAIRGRGIISGEKTLNYNCPASGGTNTINLGGGTVNLEGFIVLDPAGWTFQIEDTQNFIMDNVKNIAWRGNGDGIDLLSVSSASVKNVFVRATDDTFALKSDPSFVTPTGRPTENVVFQDSVAWADGAGHAIAFMEQTTPYMGNVQFKNIDILHSYVEAVWFEGGTNIHNITMDDVRVEDMQGSKVFLMEGTADNVYINNFQVLGGNSRPSSIRGSVSNATFNNLNYFGNIILSPGAGQFTIGSGASNIKFTQGGSVPPTPTPTTPSSLYSFLHQPLELHIFRPSQLCSFF